MGRVLPADLELWLTGYVRDVVLPSLTVEGADLAEVSNKEPSEGPFPDFLVVIRDDGSAKTSVLTGTTSVGVTVLGGTRLLDYPARLLSRHLFAALTDEDLPVLGGRDCPIAAVTDFNGPYSVPESQDRARIYFTAEYAVVGTPAG